jgi:ATP-dependent DNA helicase Q1
MICNTLNIESESMLSESTAAALQNNTWSANFDWEDKIQQTLVQVFHCNEGFRPLQREIINATLAGRDCFVVMKTGGGKSMCYQLPAMVQGGITVVVSPLLSLISDQVHAMNRRSPGSAAALTSCTDRSSASLIYKCFKEGNDATSVLRLVYVTPERVNKSKQFIAALELANKAKRLTRFVVDEAHCCSQWGHDFRNDYGQLHVLKTIFPHVPMMALTATAPHKLTQDVKNILLLTSDDCVTFRSPSNRPNLHYEVLQKPNSDTEAVQILVDWIHKHKFSRCSGIVYCFSRKESDTLAEALRSFGIKSGAYHAGCEDSEKERVHSSWQEGSISIVTATIAFGLGTVHSTTLIVSHSSHTVLFSP